VVPIGGLDAPRPRREWHSPFLNVNTDAMAFATEPEPAGAEAPGRAALAAHIEAFVAGFADLYRFLLRHRDALVAADGPLAAFRGLPVRVLLGSTRGYVLIQRRAAAYAHLGDGADWSIQLNFRSRLYLSAEVPPDRWRALAAERRAMARLDIPLFTASTDADSFRRLPEGATQYSPSMPIEIAGAPARGASVVTSRTENNNGN
jgi:lantibiotic modifying enzyme